MDDKRCERCAERVPRVGVSTSLILMLLKFIVGVTSGSHALIADGLHSASNIVTGFATTLSRRISRKQVSDRFPYGFGKMEFLAAGGISLLITLGAVALIAVSFKRMISVPSPPPHFSALLVAVISIGANELLFRYMRCAGTRLKSPTIMAYAWANRADCFSSIVVVVGIVGAKLGYHHLDPIAALVVVAIIIKVSIKIIIDSVKALMDFSVNDAYGEDIRTIVEGMEDVRALSGLKTRQIGQKVWVEMDILIDPGCSIREGHMIAQKVQASLLDKLIDLEKVMVHFQPMEQKA